MISFLPLKETSTFYIRRISKTTTIYPKALSLNTPSAEWGEETIPRLLPILLSEVSEYGINGCQQADPNTAHWTGIQSSIMVLQKQPEKTSRAMDFILPFRIN